MTDLGKRIQKDTFADQIKKFTPAGKFLFPEKTNMGHIAEHTVFPGDPQPRQYLADSHADEADIHEVKFIITFDAVLYGRKDNKNIVFLDLELRAVKFNRAFALCYEADTVKRKDERTFIDEFPFFTNEIQRSDNIGRAVRRYKSADIHNKDPFL